MIEGLRRNGVQVVECHEPLWRGIQDRVQTASGGWLRPGFVARVARTYWRLLRAYRQIDDYDVVVLGYPGQLDVYLARLLTWLRRKPLVLDVFMSLYLIASERGLTARHRITARLLYGLEKLACLLPDRLILDTAEYVQWFKEVYGLEPDRFLLVPTGADDRLFSPQAHERTGTRFRLVYYGTFIPNHGVEHIVEAARILKDEADVHFELIGDGPDRARAEALAREYGLTNVTFAGWVDKQTLPRHVADADVCLGVFGVTPQSMMTVQNKIYEALAMRKPLITGESPTVRAALNDGEHLLLCRRQDPRSLAETIMHVKSRPDLQRRLAEQGYERYAGEFTTAALGRRFREHLESIVEQFLEKTK
jgi:glycosyltransferase involved in cell wall biosynthesis